ncbi:MAG: DUF5081 family protein [Thomasclavelia sp.]|nr:DUF5081 family protein [Thomasclavelia sp.]
MDTSIEEMNFLCQILEKQYLPGFETFSTLGTTQVKKVKESLFKKGFLNENYTLTDKGIRYLKELDLYVNADEYLKFGDKAIFAKYQRDEYVLVIRIDKSYRIELVHKDEIKSIILSKFNNWNDITKTAHQQVRLETNKFISFIENNSDLKAIFLLKTNTLTKRNTDLVLYIYDGYLNCFNVDSKKLDMYCKDEVPQAIDTIISVS